MIRRTLITVGLLLLAVTAIAGTWTTKGFIYKPSVGARGETEKNTFDTGLDRVDARLGNEIWVGDPRYGTTLQDAVTAIGSNQASLRIPAGAWNLNTDLTIPANITLKPERGAVVSIPDGKTLTINGGLEAGLYQVFSWTGTGKVVFGGGYSREVFPQWWGAKGNGTNDDTAACNAAHKALPVDMGWGAHYAAGTVHYVSGKYIITGPIIFRGNTKIIGASQQSTLIYNATPDQDSFQSDHTIQSSAANITFRDLSIQGDGSASSGAGISLDDAHGGASKFFIENVDIYGHFNGVYFKDAVMATLNKVRVDHAANDGFNQAGSMNGVTLTSCYANVCGRHGYYMKPTASTFISCAVDSSGQDGYHLYSNSVNDAPTAISFQGCSAEANGHANFYASAPRDLSIISFWGYNPAAQDGVHLDGGNRINLAGCFAQGTAGYGLYLGVEPYGGTGVAALIQSSNSFSGGAGVSYTHANTSTTTILGGGALTSIGGVSQNLLHLQPRANDNYNLELRSVYNTNKTVELVEGPSGNQVFSYAGSYARFALGKNVGTVGVGYADSTTMPTYNDGVARFLVGGTTSLVGIRTDAPSYALDVVSGAGPNSGARITGNLWLGTNTDSAGTGAQGIFATTLANGNGTIGKIVYGTPGGTPGIVFFVGPSFINRFNLSYKDTNHQDVFLLAFDADGDNGINLKKGGNIGIRTSAPTAALDINADRLRLRTAKTPASASDTGNAGDICWDANYLYVCVATNTWKRVALSSW